MARPQQNLEQVNSLWFVTLGITALAAGMLVYVLLLQSALGAFSISEFNPSTRPVNLEPRVAILNSNYTRQLQHLSPDDPEGIWLDQLLSSWHVLMGHSLLDQPYSLITDRELEDIELEEYFDVLVLPAALSMSDLQLQKLEKFVEAGGNIFASWKMGYYYPDGTERGWDPVEWLFGIEVEEEVDRYSGVYSLYTQEYPGTVTPGIYTRLPVGRASAAHGFDPLRGYLWADSLGKPQPQQDHALAEPVSVPVYDDEGQLRYQPGMRISYFSWNENLRQRLTPYQHASYGNEKFSLVGHNPLVVGLPTGTSVSVQVFDPSVRFKGSSESNVAGYWTELHHRNAADSLDQYGGLVYGNRGEGRFVYLGFRRDAMGGQSPSRNEVAYIDQFFVNVVKYLLREPVMWKDDWPNGHPAAALLAGVGNVQINQLRAVSDSLAVRGLKGSYFIRPARADLYRTLVRRLHITGEVGVLDDLRFAPDNAYLQTRDRLISLRDVMKDIVEGEVLAYRAVTSGAFADTTKDALEQAGFLVTAVDSMPTFLVPSTDTNQDDLVEILASYRSDSEILAYLGREASMESLRDELLKDADRAYQFGGLYHLAYSSDVLGKPDYSQALVLLADTLKERDFWVATAGEVAQWWNLRQGVQATLDKNSKTRLVLYIQNLNPVAFDGLSIKIDMGRKVDRVTVRPELIGGSIPTSTLDRDSTILSLDVARLKPQQTRLFHIDLINENDSTAVQPLFSPASE